MKNRCLIPTPPALRAAGTAVSTRLVKKTVFSPNESGGRTPEDMATHLRTDLTGTSHPTCLKDMVSPTWPAGVSSLTVSLETKLVIRSTFSFVCFFFIQSSEQQCRARCTSYTRRQVSAPGMTLGYRGMIPIDNERSVLVFLLLRSILWVTNKECVKSRLWLKV